MVVDVVTSIALIEGDGVETLWSHLGDSMERIIESFRMAGAIEIAEKLQSTAFFKDIIAKTPADADEWAYESPEQEQMLTDVLFFVSEKGADAREGLLRFLPKKRN